MKTILLLNGSKVFGNSAARLNNSLQALAKQTLSALDKEVLETHIDKGYNEDEELEKILKADALIWQFPAWWMGEPWIVKEYIDKVYLKGFGTLFANDGRKSANPSENYGTGGLAHDKKYMLCTTWNAPLEAFEKKDDFFGGIGIDGVLLHLHKAHEFCAMSRLASFTCYDVVKNPQVDRYLANYKIHLENIFKS